MAQGGSVNSLIDTSKSSVEAAAKGRLGELVYVAKGDMFNGLVEIVSASKAIKSAGGVTCVCRKAGDWEGVLTAPGDFEGEGFEESA